ncbi:MAG: hypothetical protein AAFN70_17870, partial [Planctomycetota bacterium]
FSMPHLAELQTQYADQGVQLVSISDEPLETVTEFLKRNVPASVLASAKKKGDAASKNKSSDAAKPEPITFDQLTSAYCLTTDPDESCYKDYMRAANQNGIPTAFVVGKTGVVEWIGHPMQIDEPLEQIVSGTWDRAAAKEKFELEIRADAAFAKFRRMAGNNPEKALAQIASLRKEFGADNWVVQSAESMRASLMLEAKQFDELVVHMTEVANEDPTSINSVAWSVCELHEAGNLNNASVLNGATEACRIAVAKLNAKGNANDPALLDTLAHLYAATGQTDIALVVQAKAVQALGPNPDPAMAKPVNSYMAELNQSAKPSGDDTAEKQTEEAIWQQVLKQ